MRVIITGGTGLIGRALAADLASAGCEVFLLSRTPEAVAGLPSGVRAVRWDGRTANGWGKLAGGAAAIVNLAGENLAGESFFPSRWTPERKAKIVRSRLDAGAAVVEAVEAASVKPLAVIQSSGVGIYGPRRDELLSEEAPIGNDFLATLAVQWEASTAAVEALGVRRAVIRTGAVLSATGGALARTGLALPAVRRRLVRQRAPMAVLDPPGRRGGRHPFLDREPRRAWIFNLTAPQPLTGRDFGRAIGRVMGRPAFLPVPAIAMRLAFGEVTTVVLDGQRAHPARLLELGFRFRFPDAGSALVDLLRS